jgi:hypothetical protein
MIVQQADDRQPHVDILQAPSPIPTGTFDNVASRLLTIQNYISFLSTKDARHEKKP